LDGDAGFAGVERDALGDKLGRRIAGIVAEIERGLASSG
jgi:hypothetical protein